MDNERAEALFEILRIEIRQNLQQSYTLDLGEMYQLIDYQSAVRERLANQKHTITQLMRRENELLAELGRPAKWGWSKESQSMVELEGSDG